MTVVMVYDTETTGFPAWDKPSDHPTQPYLVQYTAVLFDDVTRVEHNFDSMIVKPTGWTIPAEATAKHGITTEQALAEGVPLIEAVEAYRGMIGKAELIAGFNLPFDMRIMRIAMRRCGFSPEECQHLRESVRTMDVMRQVTPVCRIPPTDKMMAAGRKTFKSPTLAEAIKILMNEDLDDAHDSRADVLATMRLYLHCNRRHRPFVLA